MASVFTKATQKLVLILDKHGSALKKSSFNETGKLTPEEFVIAGDFLVENFPSWSWGSGLPDKRRAHLPPEKQFLQTRNVPCFDHAGHETVVERALEGADGEGWIDTTVTGDAADAPIQELHADAGEAAAAAVKEVKVNAEDQEEEEEDDADVPELGEGYDYSNALADDDKAAIPAAAAAASAGVASTRTYDITITYDVHYSTPRVWLFGYDSEGKPLKESEWRQDFSAEHVDKTVTYEAHPHLGYSCPSIHPCKHASAMIKMVQLLGGQPLDVKYYMIIFLKFIQAMIPNMEYDYTSQFQVVEG